MSRKYQLETIPVWRALENGGECLLCDLEAESERRNTEFFLGSALMAPDMRVKLNARGFCPRHFHMLGRGTGKLGLSLVLATHIDDLAARFLKLTKQLESSGDRRQGMRRAAEDLAGAMEDQELECLMCDRIAVNLHNYTYTICTLFGNDESFRASLQASRGFCLHHTPALLRMGTEVLKPGDLPAWHGVISTLLTENLARLSEELEQFTWQFDAASEKSTPETARDAVSRAVQKLSGFSA